MKREFRIDEIMLGDVSGEVRGVVDWDLQSGLIDRVDCKTFCFRCCETDVPVLLDAARRAAAIDLIERLLQRENGDLASSVGRYVASANSISAPFSTASQQVLADYLETPSRRQRAAAEPGSENRIAL